MGPFKAVARLESLWEMAEEARQRATATDPKLKKNGRKKRKKERHVFLNKFCMLFLGIIFARSGKVLEEVDR